MDNIVYKILTQSPPGSERVIIEIAGYGKPTFLQHAQWDPYENEKW